MLAPWKHCACISAQGRLQDRLHFLWAVVGIQTLSHALYPEELLLVKFLPGVLV